jgi:hypothetical protein
MQIQGRYRATVPLIQQAALEIQIMNAGGPAVAAEWALATTRRRLVAYPCILTFKKNGALVSPLSDRHVRARAELALALEQPIRDTAVADASTRFLARGGQWSPSAAVKRRIEQTALGRQKCGRV